MTTPPRRMLEVGAEGDYFNPHAESLTCIEQGCVPADARRQAHRVTRGWAAYLEQSCVPADAPAPTEASQRLREAAQAVVTASHEVYLVPHPTFEQAMQALAAALREGEG